MKTPFTNQQQPFSWRHENGFCGQLIELEIEMEQYVEELGYGS